MDKKVIQLISDFKDNKENVVIIEKNGNNTNILKAENLGAIVLIGEYSDFFMLAKAKIHRANYLIAFTDNDYQNIEVGINANRILKEKEKFQKSKIKAKIKCFIHIRDTDLRNTEFLLDPHPRFILKTFNIFENSTRFLFLSKAVEPILKKWSERKQVHLLIVGFREMGEAVLLQAAKLGVFPEGEKLKFTILDQNIHIQKDNFMYRYPNIEEICDITFKELELDNLLELKKILIDEDLQNVTAIFLCLDDKSLEIQYKDCLISELEYEKIPMYIHIDDNEEVIKLPTNYPIFAFGLVENLSNREFIVNEKLDDLARLIHDDFRSLFKEMPEWDNLVNFKKESNRLQADHNLIKLRIINRRIAHFKGKSPRDFKFTDEELELLARMEHNRWCAEQYIYLKDLTKEASEDLKPFDELPEIEKEKDYNAVKKIPSLLAGKKNEIL